MSQRHVTVQGGLIDDGDRYNSASVGACAVTGEAVGLFLATVGSEALFHISFKDRQKYEIARIERWFAWDLDSAIYGRLLDVAVRHNLLIVEDDPDTAALLATLVLLLLWKW